MIRHATLKYSAGCVRPREHFGVLNLFLLAFRRAYLNQFLGEGRDVRIISTSASPILGTPHCLTSSNPSIREYIEAEDTLDLARNNPHTHQLFLPEKTASPHPRFLGLAQSIYERRGKKVDIRVPLFRDENTDCEQVTEREPHPGEIYMDAMHFGMGCACLQITYESENINHARFLYDMLLPWTPIMSVLSATTPIFKGQLSDHDFRWEVIEQSADCRTDDEKDPLSDNYINKSRYSTVSRYISNHRYVQNFHNDVHFKKLSPEVKQALTEKGIDERLADHVASLFIRSPIPVYKKELEFPCCQKK